MIAIDAILTTSNTPGIVALSAGIGVAFALLVLLVASQMDFDDDE